MRTLVRSGSLPIAGDPSPTGRPPLAYECHSWGNRATFGERGRPKALQNIGRNAVCSAPGRPAPADQWFVQRIRRNSASRDTMPGPPFTMIAASTAKPSVSLEKKFG